MSYDNKLSYNIYLMWTHVLHYRCHTFGIGPEVCTELVTGIAAVSGGRCVLLREAERLQTKVRDNEYKYSYPIHLSPGYYIMQCHR